MELPTNFWDGPFVNCVAVVVELLSGAQLCNPWTVAFHSSLSFTISWSLLKLMSVVSLISSNLLILCHTLLLLLSVFPSMRVLTSELALCIRWPKYWSSSSASVFPMNIQGWFPLGLTGLISLPSKGLSRVFSSSTIQKDKLFGS